MATPDVKQYPDNEPPQSSVSNARKTTTSGELPVEREFFTEAREGDLLNRLRNPERQRKNRIEERRAERAENPLSLEEKARQNARTKKLIPIARNFGAKKKVKAGTAAVTIIASTAFFYVVQFCAAVISLVGLAGEQAGEGILWGLGSTLFPGISLFAVGWVVAAFIGIGSLLYAISIFLIRGINPFQGMSIVILALCFAGYMATVLNIFPLVWFWCLYVVWRQ